MARAVTIRQSLIRSFAPVVLVVAVAAFALLFFAGRFAVRTLSAELIDQTYARVVSKLDAFFDPVLLEMQELTLDIEHGDLDPADLAGTRSRFGRVVSSVPHVAAALVADDTGREIMVLRMEDDWLSHFIPVGGERAQIVRWNRGEAERPELGPDGYDSRTRPWFIGAKQSEGQALHWTEPYKFFTSGQFGITLSRSVQTPSGQRYVVALDVLLHELDEFTRSLRPQHSGQAYLLDGKGRVLGLPSLPIYDDPETRAAAMLKPIGGLENNIAADSGEAYAKILRRHDTQFWNKPYRFISDGSAYWSQADRRVFAGGLVMIPGIIISEDELLGPITTARWISLALGVTAIAFALWRCVRVAGRFSGPIVALANESDRITRGAQTIDHQPVASPVVELAKLSSSQVEMRHAMKTLGKLERDLQVAREIQQALLPTELPDIPGWSFAVWSDPADETGGDIYDIAQIGGDGDVFMLLADATGHGVGPAISVAQVRAMARMALRTGADLRTLMSSLNAQLCEDLPSGRFITLWAAKLDPNAATLHTLSAGQAPLLHYIAAEDRFENTDANDLPLGILEETEFTDADREVLAPGDFYAVFSDGIYEARSPAGEFFGTDRVSDALQAARNGTAQDAMDAVRLAVEAFVAGHPATDDCTGVIIKCTP